jgi:hypothetical protein
MALKADRIHVDSQIDFFMNEEAERGKVAVISTVGSGSAMDQAQQLATCTYTTISGVRPLGVLMCDMVNLDLTRQHENWHKEEVQKGGKVTIWNKCTVVTNQIYPGVTPTAGQTAYLAPSGFISNVLTQNEDSVTDGKRIHTIGRFLSTKDEDGYAKVSINLP